MSRAKNYQQTSKFDNVQLRQKIIHLQSELSRYKELVSKYQNNYHYTQFDKFNDEVNILRQEIFEKEETINKLIVENKQMESEIATLKEGQPEYGDSKEQLNDKIEQLEKENKHLIEQSEMVKLQNSSLQKTLDHQEEEVMKLREALEIADQDRSLFKSKKATLQLKKEVDTNESWFLRTLKQQNKDEN